MYLSSFTMTWLPLSLWTCYNNHSPLLIYILLWVSNIMVCNFASATRRSHVGPVYRTTDMRSSARRWHPTVVCEVGTDASARRWLTTVVHDVGGRCVGPTLAHDRIPSYAGVRPPADLVRSKYDVGLRMGYLSVRMYINVYAYVFTFACMYACVSVCGHVFCKCTCKSICTDMNVYIRMCKFICTCVRVCMQVCVHIRMCTCM